MSEVSRGAVVARDSARPEAQRSAGKLANRLGVRQPDHLKHYLEPPLPERPWNPGFGRDHHGKRYGKLSVVRFHARTGAGRATWLVRCDCGDYELRRGTSLGIFKHKDDRCWVCSREEYLAQSSAEPAERESSRDALPPPPSKAMREER